VIDSLHFQMDPNPVNNTDAASTTVSHVLAAQSSASPAKIHVERHQRRRRHLQLANETIDGGYADDSLYGRVR
jgi:hypothetical protein